MTPLDLEPVRELLPKSKVFHCESRYISSLLYARLI
jgi:hypothetical protein